MTITCPLCSFFQHLPQRLQAVSFPECQYRFVSPESPPGIAPESPPESPESVPVPGICRLWLRTPCP